MPKNRVKRHAVTQPLDKPYRLIPLTQGKNAIVDLENFSWLSQWNWCAGRQRGKPYAVRAFDKMPMHRLILKCREDVDHKGFP